MSARARVSDANYVSHALWDISIAWRSADLERLRLEGEAALADLGAMQPSNYPMEMWGLEFTCRV